MTITLNGKAMELCYKTRLVQQFEERMKVENTVNFWTSAAQNEDLRVLATALLVFSNGELQKLDDAYDAMDEYMESDEGACVSTLYLDLLQEINAKGFFGPKMSRAELAEKMAAPVIDVGSMLDKVAANMADQMVSQTTGHS